MKSCIIALILTSLLELSQCNDVFRLSKTEITLLLGEAETFDLEVRKNINETLVHFYSEHEELVSITPKDISVSTIGQYPVSIRGLHPGLTFITYNSTTIVGGLESSPDDFISVVVQHSSVISLLSVIVGWVYFVAWSVSFYPQIYVNFKRKSVVGLNFDFLSLNIIGFCLYTTFNIGLYFIPEVEQEYFDRNPQGLNPVQINDVVFSVHAATATLFTIFQCLIYERGEQRVSIVCRCLIGIFIGLVILSASLAGGAVIDWLDFLYYCSYIKLAITLIKYIPQAYMNYKRKSTVGWSIGNIFLDFTGGILSMLQMLLNAYNYDDWISIFGDPTKFGLGLFSVVFDIFFIIQHYILYRVKDNMNSNPENPE